MKASGNCLSGARNLDDEEYASGSVDVIRSVLTSWVAPRTYGVSVRWVVQ
jgi:hypothetical protein